MKNLFSINKGIDDNAVAFDDNPYLARRISEETRDKLDSAFDILRTEPEAPQLTPEQTALKKKARIQWAIGLISLVGALALFAIVGDQMGAVPTIIQFALLAVSIVATILARGTENKFNATRQDEMKMDFSEATESLNAAAEEAARELGVPHDAETLEILPFKYKISGDKQVPAEKKNRFDNIATSAWIEEGHLCLATAQELFRVPLSAIRATRRIDEDFEIDFWLKGESCDSEQFAEFKIRSSGFLGKKSRGFYAVEIAEDYEFFVPGYDWSIFVSLTNMGKDA